MASTAAQIALAQDDEQGCVCTKMIWAYILATVGMSLCLTLGVMSVLNIMLFHGGLAGVIVAVYSILLGLLCICAEMRSFVPFRKFVYPVMKQVYFMTMPVGRAIFYLFLGSITFDTEETFSMLLGIGFFVLFILMIVVNIVMGLPVYIDIQMIKDEAEQKLRDQQQEFDRRLLEARQQTPKFQQEASQAADRYVANAAAVGGRSASSASAAANSADPFSMNGGGGASGSDSQAARMGYDNDDDFYEQK
jgi:hypothetical protein